jgi:hypothetical protein
LLAAAVVVHLRSVAQVKAAVVAAAVSDAQ